MMRLLAPLLAAVLVGAAAAPPAAPTAPVADHPPLVPARDALLGYHLLPATGESINVRVAVRAGAVALRVDLPDQTYMLASPKTQGLVLVVPASHAALDLPWTDGPQTLFLLDSHARYVRKGAASVAGQPCTMWDTTIERTRFSVCVSAEGFVLRNLSVDAQGHRNLVEAFAFGTTALPVLEYEVPLGFERLAAQPAPAQ